MGSDCSNGANLSFPIEFGIDDSAGKPNAALNQWIVGLVNAAPDIAIASLYVDAGSTIRSNNLLGRRGTIFIAAIFCLLTPIVRPVLRYFQTQSDTCRGPLSPRTGSSC